MVGSADAAEPPALPAEYLTHERAGFEFGYHPSARDRVRPLIEQAERVRSELTEQLGKPLLATVRVRVAVHRADLERVLPTAVELGRDLVTDSASSLLAVSVQTLTSDVAVAQAFRRGMAELALEEAGGAELPRWLRLGFSAQFADPSLLARRRALFWAPHGAELVGLDGLDDALGDPPLPGSLAEAQAVDVVRFMSSNRPAFQRLMARCREGASFDGALEAAFQLDRRRLEANWRGELARQRAWLASLFAGTVVLLAVSSAVYLRRARRSAQAKLEARAVDANARVAAPVRLIKVVRRKRETWLVRAASHDPDVPRISHDGRWHTLH